VAKKPVNGRSWECVHESPSQWMGFPHLYYYSNPEYAYRFLKKAADRIYLKK
jgi:cobyrinic acid a,c-diamide synthase